MTVTATVGEVAGAPAQTTSSGQFYADAGAAISRYADRVLVGAAADNPGQTSRDTVPTDWLSKMMGATSIGAWPVWGAQFSSLARYGSTGILGASRTSDATASRGLLGYVPSSIGVASWAVSDDTSAGSTSTGYAFYGETWRMAGADQEPCFGLELEAVNFGGLPTGVSTPYKVNVGGGAVGVQLGAGGGQTSGTSDAASGITFVSNPNAWQVGIVFGADALTGTNGKDAGYASAISMACNHAIEWHTPEVVSGADGINVGAFVRSTVTRRADGGRLEFADGTVSVSNIDGKPMFVVQTSASPDNILMVQSGTGTQAAGLYAIPAASGNGNIGLFPASGGELQISSPISGSGSVMPATVGGGFLHININGADYRIPLCTVEQAGG
ncbi:hypothetical protein [Ameyamaea chiangmaiensis]|nr:hypothetical protein [Ameyamaea chiangmaiensis]